MFNAIKPLGTSSGGPLETSIPHVCIFEKYHNSELFFDPRDPIIDEAAHGFGFLVCARVDANHAGDTTTRRSRTGYIA